MKGHCIFDANIYLTNKEGLLQVYTWKIDLHIYMTYLGVVTNNTFHIITTAASLNYLNVKFLYIGNLYFN